ncbi:MAG: prepilin-type N-terminal cleavage/methylation domain-containing protein [Sulfurimonas sp.]|nr:prepilin-type N-terminal cleavage/methylation domain-containing protein [Sulfurimonas sp.]
MKKAFTLIELLIVVLLISIVYGIYFYTMSKNAKVDKFSLFEVKKYLNSKALVYGDKLSLVCSNDEQTCYILNDKKELVEELAFKEKVKTFFLQKDETLEPILYKNIEIGSSIYIKPDLIFKRLSKREFEVLVYYTSDDKWVYVSPYFDDTKEFINQEDIVSYIKKREYLPMYSGLAE